MFKTSAVCYKHSREFYYEGTSDTDLVSSNIIFKLEAKDVLPNKPHTGHNVDPTLPALSVLLPNDVICSEHVTMNFNREEICP